MSIEERLEKLERELTATKRRNRGLLVVVVLAVVGLGLTWALRKTPVIAQAQMADAVPKVIRANKFILEDEGGKPRAMLGMLGDKPGLLLADANGKPRAVLGVNEEGPVLSLNNANGKPGVTLVLCDHRLRDHSDRFPGSRTG